MIIIAGPVAVETAVNVFGWVEVVATVEVVITWGVEVIYVVIDVVEVVNWRSGVVAEEPANAFWYWSSAIRAKSETARVMIRVTENSK